MGGLEKELKEQLNEMIANWGNYRPLRLMSQNKARFGHITDKCYCWCHRPDCSLVSTMVTQQYTYAYGAASPHLRPSTVWERLHAGFH
ncbi:MULTISPECIES: hypothetical protein [Nitrosomonas]|uniref:Uncharacterized protein n=1 Tax=Nitrosomonas communis TaxID=44574 RepID=A0A0F7KD74_9PROT|nr:MULTISPECIES: hypothetical protein [Nitrosomonas]AKH38455.1 hypothetical protein AAW31_12680 [Nitrosomonas communis]TYP87772.1 hypothetical protein BCL69_10234 [Nitrosomonas communis]UVS60487.1 hypothetical protein NX761_13355 [Nitrosomonas sp. PLL12]